MARCKEYDCQTVLDAATRAFWEKGYKGISINDLVKATGLNKHSMYQEFGSKEGLFGECIDNYVHALNRDFGRVLRRKPLGLKNIEDFFRNRIDYAASGKSIGCLLVSTVVEKEQVDEAVFDRVKRHMALQEEDFCRCLMAAREKGEIPPDKDPKVLAGYLFSFLMGLAVMGRTNPSKESVEKLYGMVISTVKS
ncbi:MAG: TetR/AcrR family transcriptional regulator [Desulfobacteraceae bacterium]|nr:TetR/AcrR family transcriptional regulator [Desulfobacteraceae bacterium]